MKLLSVEPRDPKAWKRGIDALNTFLPEGVFHFTTSGVKLASIDPSQIVYTEFSVPASFFSEYSVASPDIAVPVSISEMAKILARVGSSDRLRMELEDVELLIHVRGGGGRVTREFRLGLVDVQEQEFHVVEPESPAFVKIPAGVLRAALKDAALFSNSVVFRVTGDAFIVETKGSGGYSRTVIRAGSGVEIKTEEGKRARYSLPFLMNILKEADAETTVHLSFSTDAPLLLQYMIDQISLSFFLAHMIL